MKRLFVILVLTFVQTQSFAREVLSGYDEILRELNQAERASMDQTGIPNEDPIRIHGSVGMVASRLNLAVPSGLGRSQNLQGVEAVVGIDLFTRRWLAEGALRSFEAESYSTSNLSMREFDLRIINQSSVARNLELRWGAGMAARYVNFSGAVPASGLKSEYSTPASILLLGLRFNFSRAIGVSADTTLRSRLVNDTIDRGSFDAALRVTGTF